MRFIQRDSGRRRRRQAVDFRGYKTFTEFDVRQLLGLVQAFT